MRLFALVAILLFVVQSSPLTQPSAQAINLALKARSVQPGEAVLLTISTASPATDVHVRVFGRDVRPYPTDRLTWQALIGIDLDVKPGRYVATVNARVGDATRETTRTLAVTSKAFSTRRLTVDPNFVEPPANMTARIASEAAMLDQLWSKTPGDRLWTAPFVRPVREAPNSAFGSRSVYNGVARSPHGGADFPSPTGTPIHAPNAGRVVLARDLYFTGNTVVLDHGAGLLSVLAHLSVIDVREGAIVSVGQEVGKVGATGRVTGPHLHWAIRLGGARVDPMSLLTLVGP